MEGESNLEALVREIKMDKLKVYKGKKVLLTGHTGFKGSWMALWLQKLGAEVIGVSLDPRTDEDNFVLAKVADHMIDLRQDIRNYNAVQNIVDEYQPEFLFHLAAQPLVLNSYEDPLYTHSVNYMGTANLLEAFRKSDSLHTGVFITTDKCYENKEWVYGYREEDALGGHDPYSASKGAAEIVAASYRKSFFSSGRKRIATGRAGNVIGGGDWSPNRIIVDYVKAIETNRPLEVRNPLATRPWQHVLEPIGGYLLLGAKMFEDQKFDEAWNFGPERSSIVSVEQLLHSIELVNGKSDWKDVSSASQRHEAQSLSLDISKARFSLGWRPAMTLKQTVYFTMEWYNKYQNVDVRDLCLNQIEEYTQLYNA